ncbi:hypothetical protein SDC9_177476 [bioreactor metagenome]|uniref:Uncharacterized protein n=1 Tax=bioreactor metagenome TaxID=1076179 RepID=A0A645GW86_9ZZZZ
MCVVCAEERGVFPVFAYPRRCLFKNELLCSCYAYVAGRVGSCLKYKLHAEVFAGLLHDEAASSECFVAHVTGEGDMDKSVASEFFCCVDDEIAAGDEVRIDRKVCDR